MINMLRTLTASTSGPLAAGEKLELSLRVPNATPAPLRNVRVSWPQPAQLSLIAVDGKATRRRTTSSIGFIAAGTVATVTATYEVTAVPADDEFEKVAIAAGVTIGEEEAETNDVALVFARSAKIDASAKVMQTTDVAVMLLLSLQNVGDAPAADARIYLRVPPALKLRANSVVRSLESGAQVNLEPSDDGQGGVYLNIGTVPGSSERYTLEADFDVVLPCMFEHVAFDPIAIVSPSCSQVDLAVAQLRLPEANLRTSTLDVRQEWSASQIELVIRNSGCVPVAADLALMPSGDVEIAGGSLRWKNASGAVVKLRAKTSRGRIVASLPPIAGGDAITVSGALFRVNGDAGEVAAEIRRGDALLASLKQVVEAYESTEVRFAMAPTAGATLQPGEIYRLEAEAWNVGTLPTSLAIEASGDLSMPTLFIEELKPGQVSRHVLELRAPDAGASEKAELRATIVATYADEKVTIAEPCIAFVASAVLDGRVDVVLPTTLGDDVEVRCFVRNAGTAVAHGVRIDLVLDGADVVDEPPVLDLAVGEEVIFPATIVVREERAEPIVVRAKARCEGARNAHVLRFASFVPEPAVAIEDLSMHHVGEAIVGDLVAIKTAFRNGGKSAVPQLTLRAQLGTMTFVPGSLRVNGKPVMADVRLLEGIALERFAAGAGITLDWLCFASEAGLVDPMLTVTVAESTFTCSAGAIEVNLPSAFALGSLTLDGAELGEALPAIEAAPVLAVAAAAVEPPVPFVPTVEPAPASGVQDASTSGEDGSGAQSEAEPVVAIAEEVAAEPALDAAAEPEPETIVAGTPAIAPADVAPPNHEAALFDRHAETRLLANGDPQAASTSISPMPTLPAELSIEDLEMYSVIDVAPVEDKAAVEELQDVAVECVMFALELPQAKLVQAHKYLRAVEAAVGDTLLLHALSLRPFLPTRVLDARAHIIEDTLTRVRERFEMSFDGILAKRTIDPDARVDLGDLETLTARSALIELVKRFMGPNASLFSQPSTDCMWGVARVDPKVLRSSYASLESTPLGDAAALRAITTFFPDRLLGKGDDRDELLEEALSAYRETLLNAWSMYEENPDFEAALVRPAHEDLTARRAALLEAIGGRVLVRA